MAVPALPLENLHQWGGDSPDAHATKAIIGPGTGLGVSGLLWCNHHWTPIIGEGGHVSFSPQTELEAELLKRAWKTHAHISAERLICGDGLLLLYKLLCDIHNVEYQEIEQAEITSRAQQRSCPVCVEVIDVFCAVLGSVAGDLALTLGAFGGVYIAGGIVPKLGELFYHSDFRTRFEAKGRFDTYLQRIPVYILPDDPYIPLTGCAAHLKGMLFNE